MWRVISDSEEQTRSLGAALGRVASAGWVVALHGDLGAGKTCFAQGVGEGLSIDAEVVSPTFILVAEHEGGRLPLLHADLYRLEAPDEVENIGLEEALEVWPGVALIEWADRFPDILPVDHLYVRITIDGARRVVEVTASGAASAWLTRWRGASGGEDV